MTLAPCSGTPAAAEEPPGSVPAAWPGVAESAIRALQHEYHHSGRHHTRPEQVRLLREQARRLRELVDGGPGFDAAAALAVGSPDAPRPPRTPAPYIGGSAVHLDGDQRYAVGLGVTPGVTWLWGPPGTGKTATLSTLVTQLAEKDLRVLLAAPTTAALDVTVRAVLKQSPALADGTLVRPEEADGSTLEDRRQRCRAAGIVAATAHQVVLETLRGLTFDVVVLDEANMTSAVLAMLVAGAGRGHTIMAGDFRQLPPIARAGTLDVLDWLYRSPFERSGIAQAVARGEQPPGLVTLTGQHRMRDDIGRVVSRAFYPERPLRTADSVRKRRRPRRAPWATSELLLLDTSGLWPRTTGSRYNVTHLQLTAALVGTGAAIRSLGLVSPFAPQARLLASLVPDGRHDTWTASTVQRFQGGERDVVVYDTVDTGYGIRRLHQWYTDGHDGSTGARLLNVAASRAREHLVIVGAMDTLHCWDTDRDAVWTFFEELEVRAEHLDWQDLLYDSPATEHVTRNLVDRLRADLRQATTADIWLPRADLVNLPPLVRDLNAVPQRNVTIWVEPDAHGNLAPQARRAHREGVNIRPLTPMPESFAVIGDVVWSAANPLLGPAPGPILRTEHQALAAAVRRTQHRRSGLAPGSGHPARTCTRCHRLLVRFETSIRGTPEIRHECQTCDRAGARSLRRIP